MSDKITLTLRINSADDKAALEQIKDTVDETTSSKALIKLMHEHLALLSRYNDTRRELRKTTARAERYANAIYEYQQSHTTLMQCDI